MKFNSKEKILLSLSGIGLVLLVILKIFLPKEDSWEFNYRSNSTDPYGCKATVALLKPHFKSIIINSKPFPQFIRENEIVKCNYVIITSNFSPTLYETKHILNWVAKGNKVLVSASFFGSNLLDTLKLKIINQPFTTSQNIVLYDDQSKIDSVTYNYPNLFPNTSFNTDSTDNVEKIAKSDSSIIAVSIKFGNGEIILDAAPYLHSNYLILYASPLYSEWIFNNIRSTNLFWDDRYKPGNVTQGSLITFILNRPALKGAYLTLIIGILISFYYGIKRKERVIPLIHGIKNTSLELASALGLLWYSQKNFRSIALSKWFFYKEKVFERTKIRWDAVNLKEISVKLGVEYDQMLRINDFAAEIEKKEAISSELLYNFYRELKETLK